MAQSNLFDNFWSLNRDDDGDKNIQFVRREIVTYRQTKIGQFRWRVRTVRNIDDSINRTVRNFSNRLDLSRYLTNDSLNGDSKSLVMSQLKSCPL